MDRTERLYKIDNLLRQHQTVSFAKLQETLEVSPATLKRDLDYLRTRLNAPIEWRRSAGGYCLVASPDPDRKVHALPGLWFSSTEIHALLTMQHLLTTLDSGGLLTRHIDPLTRRLNALLGDEALAADQLRRRVRIISLAQRTLQPTHFQQVGTALVQRKRLRIAYAARNNGKTTVREVSPLRLVYYRGNWYMDAWCHLRAGLRSFAVDAMVDAHSLEAPAKEVSEALLDATFNPGYGIFSGKRVRWARLRFTPERALWVKTEQWHPDQRSSLEAGGSYLLQVPYADHRELLMDILKHGTHCEVLGPPALRQLVADEVQAMAQKYSLSIRK